MTAFSEYITIVLGLGGILGGVAGLYSYLKSANEKSYAAQRDFNHLLRNQEQLINNLSFQAKDFDERFNSIEKVLLKIEAILIAWRGRNGNSN